MKTYHQNRLIPAREIYLEGSDYYVGVPTRYLRKGITVTHGFDKMYIPQGTEAVKVVGQEQKMNTDKAHSLSYFKWIPEVREEDKIVNTFDLLKGFPEDCKEILRQKGIIK